MSRVLHEVVVEADGARLAGHQQEPVTMGKLVGKFVAILLGEPQERSSRTQGLMNAFEKESVAGYFGRGDLKNLEMSILTSELFFGFTWRTGFRNPRLLVLLQNTGVRTLVLLASSANTSLQFFCIFSPLSSSSLLRLSLHLGLRPFFLVACSPLYFSISSLARLSSLLLIVSHPPPPPFPPSSSSSFPFVVVFFQRCTTFRLYAALSISKTGSSEYFLLRTSRSCSFRHSSFCLSSFFRFFLFFRGSFNC